MKKKILVFLSLLLFTVPSFAATNNTRRLVDHRPVNSQEFDSKGSFGGAVVGNVANFPGVTTNPTLIYSITLVATANNASFSLFDNSIEEYEPPPFVVEPFIEISVATIGNSTTITFADPLPTYQGLSLTVANGQAYVEYE